MSTSPKTALLFAGQGSQVVGMGRDFHERSPLARSLFEQAGRALGCGLETVCFEGPESELTRTENAQPGIYTVSWVAFQLLKEAVPSLDFQAAAGLSLGEFTALAAADVFSFDDGIRLVRLRGQLMQEACDRTRGGMAAVIGLEDEPTRAVCEEAGVELANLNCPGQLVISGESDKIGTACELAKARGAKRALPLTVAGAYHSRLMAAAQPGLKSALDRLTLGQPSVPVISNVTAVPHGDGGSIRNLLVDQVTSSVRWEASIRFLLAAGFTRFIELGPGKALTGFMKRIDKDAQILHVSDIPSLEATAAALAGSSHDAPQRTS